MRLYCLSTRYELPHVLGYTKGPFERQISHRDQSGVHGYLVEVMEAAWPWLVLPSWTFETAPTMLNPRQA